MGRNLCGSETYLGKVIIWVEKFLFPSDTLVSIDSIAMGALDLVYALWYGV